ncbi:MAG: hypothetical protein JSR77_04085 [Planctomycetes bacterium]|nr:hypothetical protein [Planctomycetota bacterium]
MKMMKKCVVLCALAGSAIAVPALAQQFNDAMDPNTPQISMPTLNPRASSYGSRATNQFVYRIGPPTAGGGDWRSGLAGGGSNTNSYCGGSNIGVIPGTTSLSGFGLAVSTSGARSPLVQVPFAVRLNFYDGAYTPGPVASGTQTEPYNPANEIPGSQRTFLFTGANGAYRGYITFWNGIAQFFTSAIDTPADVTLSDSDFFFKMTLLETDATTPNASVGMVYRGLVAPCPGASDGIRFNDTSIATVPTGSPFFPGGPDGFYSRDGRLNNFADPGSTTATYEGLGSSTNRRALYLFLYGSAPDPVAPTPSVPEFALSDAGNTFTGSATATTAKYFKFTLPAGADVSDAALKFLDIDTEGSTADLAIALYDGTGNLLGNVPTDDGGGSGTNDLLTYGVGNRNGPEVIDARQRNGHNGEIFATDGAGGTGPDPGPYVLAVAAKDSSFGPAYCVTPSGNAVGTGDYTVNFKTNVNGAALAPSESPVLRGGQDIGTVLDPGFGAASYVLPRYETDAIKFTLCQPISPPYTFLDIDFSANDPVIDGVATIFDSTGQSIAYSDDANAGAGYFQPAFSISAGDGAPRTHGTAPLDYTGQTKRFLGAGDYWLVSSGFPLTGTATGDRFHTRSGSGSSLSYKADFYTNMLDCTENTDPCFYSFLCPADYNGDGGVDGADVAAFYADWENSVTCSDVNFDGGPDGDVETFFSFWEAGGC